MQSRNENNLKGIDISHHNGIINFDKVKNSGISIVIIKSTEGISFIDPMFQTYYKEAKASGLRIGFYHFFRTTSDAKKQAHFFINTLNGLDVDCKYVLDFEVTTVNKDISSSYAKMFMDEVESLTNCKCAIYTGTNFAKNNLNNTLSKYSLWIAHYGVNTPGSNGIWDKWAGFQYSDLGKIDGMSTYVDLDEFTEDIFIDGTSPVPIPSNNILNISQVQSTLNTKYNLNISVDNIFGPETLKAIIKGIQTELNVQFNKALLVDGIFGTKTKAALVTVKQDASGNLTWLIQGILICLGYNLSPYGADGIFGNLTKNKVMAFQASNNLTVDGIVGKNTWNKLLEQK